MSLLFPFPTRLFIVLILEAWWADVCNPHLQSTQTPPVTAALHFENNRSIRHSTTALANSGDAEQFITTLANGGEIQQLTSISQLVTSQSSASDAMWRHANWGLSRSWWTFGCEGRQALTTCRVCQSWKLTWESCKCGESVCSDLPSRASSPAAHPAPPPARTSRHRCTRRRGPPCLDL